MAKKSEVIDIESGNFIITSPAQYIATIRGLDSLLMDKMPDMSIPASKKARQTQEDRLEYERTHWKDKAYVDEDGHLYIPSENIHECMKGGSAYWGARIPGQGKKTYTDVVKSAVIVEDLIMTDKTTDDLIPYGKVVNGTPTKKIASKVYKVRPLLRPWGGSFKLHVFDGRLDSGVLKVILSYAGLYRGLCNWRPQFGRFEVVDIQKVE